LGCRLVSRRGRAITAGRIVEAEAYLGPEDKASHAAFRPGSRSVFYGEGGIAYVYLNYGVHYLLNAIAGPVGRPGCVLIRALGPARRDHALGGAASALLDRRQPLRVGVAGGGVTPVARVRGPRPGGEPSETRSFWASFRH